MNKEIVKKNLINNLISYRFFLIILISYLLSYINIITSTDWEKYGINNFLLYTLNFNSGKGTSYYIILLPFFAALMGGSLFGDEVRNRINILTLTRISKKKYLISLIFSSFILGGIGGTFPIIISMICSYLKLPYFDSNLGQFAIFDKSFWGFELFSTHPILTIVLLILITFVFCGLLANLSLVISYFIPLKIIETVLVFILSYILFLIVSLLNLDILNHNVFINYKVSESFPNSFYSLIGYIVVLSIIVYLTTLREINYDGFQAIKKNNN
ncbi:MULTISPECIES: hypothetical protein [Bacteria]|uniref:hypothetical protein n=1 Tax=Bacteria TaxID=2 RepID=UPI001F0EE174|nr:MULTISPECIES: hypothetical protein [Lactococcus]MCH5426034.1 hypothetical protein [Lactococcus lactis]MCH5428653.1 hypothetical protein [Lactococcus lactis]MCT0031083.1 hypothetical protein [Lactococcus lactis subsp. lactis]MCT0036121.1 hypothetical protein [Lactococcus lactis subsp. lactis]MCT0059779.1 hypothetical protein [Lactococcus lactis subsp. lactis]